MEYASDEWKETLENVINFLEENKTLENVKNNIGKLKVKEIVELIIYDEVNNELYDTETLENIRQKILEQNKILAFKTFYRNIEKSKITNWDEIIEFMKRNKDDIYKVFGALKNDFKIELLKDKELYNYLIELSKEKEDIKSEMPIGNNIYENEEQLNELIKAKSKNQLSYALKETSNENKIYLSKNKIISQKILEEGMTYFEYEDEIIDNIYRNIQEIIKENPEKLKIDILKKIDNEKMKEKIIKDNIAWFLDNISKNEIIETYIKSDEELQKNIYYRPIFRQILEEINEFKISEIIEKTISIKEKRELILNNIEEILSDYSRVELIKYLSKEEQSEILQKAINGEVKIINDRLFLINLDNQLFNDFYNSKPLETTETHLNNYSLSEELDLLKKQIDPKLKKIITEQIKNKFIKKEIKYLLVIEDETKYQILFEIITDEELYTAMDTFDINALISKLNSENENEKFTLVEDAIERSCELNIDIEKIKEKIVSKENEYGKQK